MTDPSEQQQEPEELDLDAEDVKDLEVGDKDGDKIKGGHTHTCACQTAH